MTHQRREDLGIIGRTLRVMLGALLTWAVFTILRTERAAYSLWVLAIVGGFIAGYVAVHIVVSARTDRVPPWTGGLLALVPVVLVFAFAGALGRVSAVCYLTVSLLVQAFRAEGGNEVLAIPALLLRRRTHLMGILFAPVDFVEKHLTGPGGLPG